MLGVTCDMYLPQTYSTMLLLDGSDSNNHFRFYYQSWICFIKYSTRIRQ